MTQSANEPLPANFRDLARRAAAGDRKATAELLALGDAAVPAVRAGLDHPDWKVRRNCLRFLDHHLDAESAKRVAECLRDEHPDVRKWAAHALGCAHCKDAADFGLDPVPLLMTVIREDPSQRVRRSATVSLAWNQPPQPRIHVFLRELLATETDPKVRLHAEGGLGRETARA